MGEILIKVNIADRHYPLKIEETDEEGVREAAKMINNRVRAYFEQFSVRDKQDVLAMCALELAAENLTFKGTNPTRDHRIEEVVDQLHQLLDDIH
jgi:cell division protein ZapA (FtsZ GTPase activity inhibitor)